MRVWGKKHPGLIDFALSSIPPAAIHSHFEARVARLKNKDGDGGLGVGYTPPEAGGRTRNDGVEVKWKVSRPRFSTSVNTPDDTLFPIGRIDAPFFCYDVTSRHVRVPFQDKEKTTHPCGAVGVSGVEILVPMAKIEAYVKLYSSILGTSPEAVDETDTDKARAFQIGLPVTRMGPSAIRIRSPQSERDVAWLEKRGMGISRLVLTIGQGQQNLPRQLGADGIASTISLE